MGSMWNYAGLMYTIFCRRDSSGSYMVKIIKNCCIFLIEGVHLGSYWLIHVDYDRMGLHGIHLVRNLTIFKTTI